MAYRKKSTSRTRSRASSVRRKSVRRKAPSRRSAGQQVVRVVIEQLPAAGAAVPQQTAFATPVGRGKARF